MAETPENIDLTFLARQMERLFREMASLRDDLGSVRDDMNVLTSIVLRQDATLTALLQEVRATHAQIQRMNRRIEKLEAST